MYDASNSEMEPKASTNFRNKLLTLLEAEKYEEALQIIHQQQGSSQFESDPVLERVVEIAKQIFLACQQHQLEISHYQQAITQAIHREQGLKTQLVNIIKLSSVAESSFRETSPIPKVQTPLSQKTTTVWKRMQSFLGSREFKTHELQPSLKGEVSNSNFNKNNSISSHIISPSLYHNGNALRGREACDQHTLSVYFLGDFRVYLNQQQIDNWHGNKAKSLFKYMLMHDAQSAKHEMLMEQFWPNDQPATARRNLYQAIYLIRQAFQETEFSPIIRENGGYRFNPELQIVNDSLQFEHHYRKAILLEEQSRPDSIEELKLAKNLYHGNFLHEDIYEEWTITFRERFKHIYFEILDKLSQYFCQKKEFATAISYCNELLNGDSCREDIHRRLMLAYAYQGQRHMALKQYHACVELLSKELGVEPVYKTNELYKNIINEKIK